MKKTKIRLSLVLILILCCQSSFAWRAGFDSQTFPATPQVKKSSRELCLAGYGMFCNREATGSHNPKARTLVNDVFSDQPAFFHLDSCQRSGLP